MNPNLEIEYKMLISEENYLKLMDIYQKQPTLQTNVYYNCKYEDLKSRGIGMRIRDVNNTHLFTLKVKTDNGHKEYEAYTNENSIEALHEVKFIFDELNIKGPYIETGRLNTYRSEIPFNHGVLCLDRNEYYGITDYELEFEIYPDKDADEGMKEFTAVLSQVNLSYIQNKKSKIQRCLNAKKKNEMKKTAIFFANGLEECEGLVTVDLLRRSGIHVDIVSMEETLMVQGSHNIKIQCDCLFNDVDFSQLDMIILPGGMPGTLHLKQNKELCSKIIEFDKQKKYLAAICAAPSVLGSLGLLNNVRMTCYPGFEDECTGAVYTGEKTEIDRHIITSRGLGAAIEFSAAIIEVLKDKNEADRILSEIQC